MPRLLDALAFSSGLASAVGAGLSFVASRALEADRALAWALLASAGTFVVYNVDRLRDIARDRETSPRRTRFIERHRRRLVRGIGLASVVLIATLATAPRSIQATCVAIGALGLLHRRLKGHAVLKTAYVSFAWLASCVGIPWLAAGRPGVGPWLAGILTPVLVANLVASNLRDDETRLFRGRPRAGLGFALGLAGLSLGVALAAPPPLPALGAIAVCEALALAGFRADERYGMLVIDGALIVGSGLAWLGLGWLGAA